MELERAAADARPCRDTKRSRNFENEEPPSAPHFLCISCLILTINEWATQPQRLHAQNMGLCLCPAQVPVRDTAVESKEASKLPRQVPWCDCSGAFRPQVARCGTSSVSLCGFSWLCATSNITWHTSRLACRRVALNIVCVWGGGGVVVVGGWEGEAGMLPVPPNYVCRIWSKFYPRVSFRSTKRSFFLPSLNTQQTRFSKDLVWF
jgi:hypothetical protein